MKSAWRYTLASVALLAALAPSYWLLTISLKREIDQFAWPPLWWNFAPIFQHYRDAFLVRSFGRFLVNSTLVAAASTLLALALGTPAAYALARFRWPGAWGSKISSGFFRRACCPRLSPSCRCSS
jgi:multiple sugar transport system permease protein